MKKFKYNSPVGTKQIPFRDFLFVMFQRILYCSQEVKELRKRRNSQPLRGRKQYYLTFILIVCHQLLFVIVPIVMVTTIQ